MSRNYGRVVLAVIAGYAVNAALVGITEGILVRLMDTRTYFGVDLATQIVATIVAGYLCCRIAQQSRSDAAPGLVMLGLAIGTVSLVNSWNSEPHWYGIALLLVYTPSVWIGYALAVRREK